MACRLRRRSCGTKRRQMDFDFTSSTLETLSTEQRVAEYRKLASQAEHRGELAIANQWRQLAADIEEDGTTRSRV
jgi:hypothetical protein